MNHPPDTRVLIHRGTGTCYRKPDLHICKFDFKNADFLHIRYKKPNIYHKHVRCNFKVYAEKL